VKNIASVLIVVAVNVFVVGDLFLLLVTCCVTDYLVQVSRSSLSDFDAWSSSEFNMASVNVSSQVVTVDESLLTSVT